MTEYHFDDEVYTDYIEFKKAILIVGHKDKVNFM